MNRIGVYFCLFLVTGSAIHSVAAAALPLRRTALFWESDLPRRHYEEFIANRQIRNSFGAAPKRAAVKETTSSPSGAINTKLQMDLKPPSQKTVAMYDRLELNCTAGGSPPPAIYWLKNGQPMLEAPNDMEEATNRILEDDSMLPIRGLSMTRSRLVVDCADEDTEAVYTCVAESIKERVVSSTYVNVEGVSAYDEKTCGLKQNSDGLAASIFTWSGTYFDDEGNDAILLCRTTGNPAPKVTWFDRYNEPITTGTDYHILSNGDLKIHNLRNGDHMGVYRCKAENRFGVDEAMTFVYPFVP